MIFGDENCFTQCPQSIDDIPGIDFGIRGHVAEDRIALFDPGLQARMNGLVEFLPLLLRQGLPRQFQVFSQDCFLPVQHGTGRLCRCRSEIIVLKSSFSFSEKGRIITPFFQ